MNKKGLFSFALVLLFASAHIAFFEQENYSQKKIGNAILTAIELEQGNVQRTLLEENVDKVIKKEIEEALGEKALKAEKIKERVSFELMDFFSNMAGKEGIEFFIMSGNGLVSKKEVLSKETLEQLISVNVVKIGNAYFAESTFTGGMLKNKIVCGGINFPNSKTVFSIPVGYTIKAAVIK